MVSLSWFTFLLLLLGRTGLGVAQAYEGVCDKPRNVNLPFCNSALSFDARIDNLVSLLTLDEKIGLLDNTAAGASANVDLSEYQWWNEALHGVAGWPYRPHWGTRFRPPTEFATVFPQVISFSSAFNRALWSEVGTAIGNEGRAFYNVGNSGITFWSPNVNIFRDPRWGRGQETPGEDPYLSGEWARVYVRALQGNESEVGFLKSSACCKHFVAHSLEADRFEFNSVVTPRDMADTYLPAFKTCVEDGDASCVMCAYNAVNGIPACANKALLTDTLRGDWGFDGYVTSDCDAAAWVYIYQNYTDTPAEACRAVFDAGMDLECHFFVKFFEEHLRGAVDEGVVPVEMLDTALRRLFRVQMRLGYYEQDAVRPYKELLPSIVDSTPHHELTLDAARQSIVLLKNAPNARTGLSPLPIDPAQFSKLKQASLVGIGPWADEEDLGFLGNYHGKPSFVKNPMKEIRRFVPDYEVEKGCTVFGFDEDRLQEAEDLARISSQVVLFVGINGSLEGESNDRANLSLRGLQPELIRRVLNVVQEPVIMFVVSAGAIDVSEYEADPRVGAIIWAGYLGQAAGEAMADVLFGNYNPAGRLTQTWYHSSFLDESDPADMNMRPVNGSPGRTYRFYTGQPLYEFGYGLSYTTFAYEFVELPAAECGAKIGVNVRNTGQRGGDHSVLWFLAPPGAGQDGRPIKQLVDFERLPLVLPLQTRLVELCLNRHNFQLANEAGEFEVVSGEWKLMIGNLEKSIIVL